MTTTPEALLRYLHAHSREWLDEVDAVGGILIVALAAPEEPEAQRVLMDVKRLFPSILVRELSPLGGGCGLEAAALEALSEDAAAGRFRYVALVRDLAHVSPLRLAALAASGEETTPEYMGLEEGIQGKCMPGTAMVSRGAMRAMHGRWEGCACAGSDAAFADGCLAQVQPCSPLRELSGARVPATLPTSSTHGAAVAAFRAALSSAAAAAPSALICGGTAQLTGAAPIQIFTSAQTQLCCVVQPLAAPSGELSPAHVRYARFLMNGAIETQLISVPDAVGREGAVGALTARVLRHAGRCRLAMNVQTAPFHVELRHVVRQTWLRAAKALGDVTYTRFIVGTPKVPLEPHTAAAYAAERAVFPHDMLQLNFTDCYHCLYFKLWEWFRHAHAHASACEYIAKVDDDTYTRVIPLINYLDTVPLDNVYFGMAFHTWATHPNIYNPVINDTSNKWHMADLFPELKFWPPYVNGNIVGLSRNLVEFVLEIQRQRPANFRVDDAALGAFLSELVVDRKTGAPLVYGTDQAVFGAVDNQCNSTLSTWDSPNFSFNYNLYDRWQDDLNGSFCRRVDRSGQPEEFQRDDGRSAMIAHKLSDRTAMWEREVPWALKEGVALPQEPPVYLAFSGTRYGMLDVRPPDLRMFGGTSVRAALDAPSAAEIKYISKRAPRFAARFCGANGGAHIGHWRANSWSSEHLWAEYCWGPAAPKTAVLLSMRVSKHPFPDVLIKHRHVSLASSRLVVTLGGACSIAELASFVNETAPWLLKLSGTSVIAIGWGDCPEGTRAARPPPGTPPYDGQAKSAPAVEAALRNAAKGIHLRVIGTGAPYTRASALRAVLDNLRPSDLVVVMDADMRISSERFFLSARAIAYENATIFFPVVFSRYSPSVISAYLERSLLSDAERMAAVDRAGVSEVTGRYDEGVGVVAAFARDLLALNAFSPGDEAAEAAGSMEGLALYNAACASRLAVLRLVSTHIVQEWRPHNCDGIKNASRSAWAACVHAQGAREGSPAMLRAIARPP